MLAHHKHPARDLLCSLPEGLPQWGHSSEPAADAQLGARSRAVCWPIRACQCARRRLLQIATATFVPGPSGTVAREAAPGTVRADRSIASTAAGALVAYNQNPGLERS